MPSCLQGRADSVLKRLEVYYPDHTVSRRIGQEHETLGQDLTDISKLLGYGSRGEFLADYGYRSLLIERRNLESSTDVVKRKTDNVLRRLEQYYPDHVISGGLEKDHKSLSSDISEVYRLLGYENRAEFLNVCGYTYQPSVGGRPAQDFQPMLDALVEKYRGKEKPAAMGVLLFENPEYKGPLKSLSNKAQEIFGTSLVKYLRSIGEEAFRGAGIQELMLPPKLEPIGVKAFAAEEYGSGAAVLKSIQISVGNPHFRIEDGFLLRQKEDGTCSLMCAFGEDKTVTVPENVSEIEPLAFCYSVVKEVRLPASVTDVAMDAFLQCRNLARLRLEFPQPENDLRWVVFYFPEKQDENEEGEESCNDYTIRKQYLDCIRTGRDGVFEVVKYDSLFPSIQGFQGPGADRYGPPEIRRPAGAAVPGRIPELAAGQRRRGGGDCHRVRRPGWPEYPGGAGHIRRGKH